MKLIYLILLLLVIIAIGIIFIFLKSNIQKGKNKEAPKMVEEVRVTEEKRPEAKVLEEQRTEEEKVIDDKIYNKNPYIQAQGIAGLELIGGEESIKKLQGLLDSPSPSTILEAVSALGRLQATDAIDKLESLYENSQRRIDGYGPSIRMEAVDALGNIQDEKSVDFLGQQFFIDENIMYKDHILDALQKIGSKQSLPYLEGYRDYLEANPGPEDFDELRFLIKEAKNKTEKIIEEISNK